MSFRTRLFQLSLLVVFGVGLVHCSTPQGEGPGVRIEPGGGAVPAGTEVRLEVEGQADVYYTLDDTTPEPRLSLKYQAPLRLWGSATLRVVAIDAEGRRGKEATATFQVDTLFPQTRASPRGGNVRDKVDIELLSDEAGAIHYTLDGSEPTLQSPVFKGPITLAKDTVLRFFGVDASGNREPAQQETYNFSPKLSVLPETGIHLQRPLLVRMTTDEQDASISYNLVLSPTGWQDVKQELSFQHDTWIQVKAEDKKGWASLVEDRKYSLIAPLALRLTKVPSLSVQAVASVDLEGFDSPGLVVATKDTLLVVTSTDNRYQEPKSLATLSFVTAWIRCWDVDGDGLNDVLLGDESGKVHLFRATSGTSVQEDKTLLAAMEDSLVQRLVPLDANADGQLDILVVERRKGRSFLLQRTTGGYQKQPAIEALKDVAPQEVLAGDFNNDRRVDLLVLPGGEGAPMVLLGQAKGGYQPSTLESALPNIPKGTQWLHAARSDFDADGELDFVLVGRSPASEGKPPQLQVVLLRHLDGEFWRRMDTLTLPDADVRGCAPADWDGDGYPDVVIWRTGKAPLLLSNFLGQRLFVVEDKHLPEKLPLGAVGTLGHDPKRGVPALVWMHDKGWSRLEPSNQPRFLHVLLQGIRGNRNAIGAHLVLQTSGSKILREIGVRATGPDQAPLFFPIPLDNAKLLRSLQVLWSDGRVRDVPQLDLNKVTVIRPN
ncbi:MAG: hypothetical protein EP343_03955 [Deltaproteobacteria bacterium]|nr:MAG: hypothetical protein EP343_03955 [Deltaproteobacteria bacterium]